MSTFSQFAGSSIKSIQRGTISFPASTGSTTVTISAVNTAKAELRFLGGGGIDSGGSANIPRISLTNSTTITAAGWTTLFSTTGVVSWELTEWN